MKKNKHKVLVLSDLKESTDNLIKSAIELTNIIKGEIHFFHVKKPVEVIKRDNQFSAMRSINEEHKKSKKEIEEILNSLSETYGVNINYKLSFGNMKTELKSYISDLKPDVIIMGKRKPKILNVFGDNLTQFILKNYNGVIMMLKGNNVIGPNKVLSLGILNSSNNTLDVSFAEDLIKHSQRPLKSFKIIQKLNKKEDIKSNNSTTTEFVFEQSNNVIDNVSKYLAKTNINLLCVERLQSNNFFDNLDVSLLLVNSKPQ